MLLERLVIARYHQISTIVYCRQKLMCASVWVCVCECVCMFMCIYVRKTFDKISSTDTCGKQL